MTRPRGRRELLFVYGTLRSDVAHKMFHILARAGRFIGDGTIKARLFDLGEYPGAVLSDRPGDIVRGELYELVDPAPTLKLLDEYEGCGPSEPEPTEFRRSVAEVMLADGTHQSAWVYLYNRPVGRSHRIVSGDYVRRRKKGATVGLQD